LADAASRARCLRPWSWYHSAAKVAACWGPFGTHGLDTCSGWCGPCTALSASLATAEFRAPPCRCSGRQGRVGMPTQRPARPGAAKGRRQPNGSPPSSPFSSVTAPGPGLLAGAAWQQRGPWCWAATTVREFTSTVIQLLAGPVAASPFCSCWLRIQTSPSPKPAVDGRNAPVARLHQAWSDSVRRDGRCCRAWPRATAANAVVIGALLAAETERRQTIT